MCGGVGARAHHSHFRVQSDLRTASLLPTMQNCDDIINLHESRGRRNVSNQTDRISKQCSCFLQDLSERTDRKKIDFQDLTLSEMEKDQFMQVDLHRGILIALLNGLHSSIYSPRASWRIISVAEKRTKKTLEQQINPPDA